MSNPTKQKPHYAYRDALYFVTKAWDNNCWNFKVQRLA